MAVRAGKMEKGRRIPLSVKVGDRILCGKYTASHSKIDDQEYLVFRAEEILAKLSGMGKAAPTRSSICSRNLRTQKESSLTQEGEV